jgi:uncharacterized protein involved in exopolysaccharide biosynthesis
MSGSVNDYITRLEQQLRQRGIVDPRILAESREHLIDAIEEGRAHGLSAADAEHEAFDRFGAPEIIAAHIHEERDRMKTGLTGAFATLWQRKWWVLVPTVCAAVVTGVAAYYFLPDRYRSEVRIFIASPRVRDGVTVLPRATDRAAELGQITELLKSRTRLESVIQEFDLYQEERKRVPIDRVIGQMRDDIRLDIISPAVVDVSFVSSDPRTAMQVAERLATFVIGWNLQERTSEVESTNDFIEVQINDVREQILAQEKMLETLRAESGGRPLSQAYVIPYETLKETYKALLVKHQDATLAANVERRQMGEQFRILDRARLPEQPDGPNRARVTILGTLVGLAIGLALVVLRRSPNAGPPALAQA